MSQESFLKFLMVARKDAALLTRYNQRNLSQMLFHAKNDGFDFTRQEVAAVAGTLEASVILNKDHDTFDGNSQLWREMWGRCHLEYLVTHVVSRHSDEELRAFFAKRVEERS